MGIMMYKLTHNSPPQLAVHEMALQQVYKEFSQSNVRVLLYSLESNEQGTDTLSSQQVDEIHAVLQQFDTLF